MYNAMWSADASLLDGGGVSSSSSSLEFSRRWIALVNKYSIRELTYSSDKLVALAGLASRTAASSGWDYLAGHWRQDLEKTLLWTAGGMPSTCGGSRHAAYQAPSWSWASVHGVEIHANIDPASSSTLEIVGASCTPRASVNPFGVVSDGKLVVKGTTASAKALERTDCYASGCPASASRSEAIRAKGGSVKYMKALRVEGEGLSLDSGTATYPDVSEFNEVSLEETYMFLKWLARRAEPLHGLVIRGLILRPSKRVPGAYERVAVHQYLNPGTKGAGISPYKRRKVIIV